MFIFIFMYGVQVMRGVMEEKQNRVVEVLISSVKPFQLMMGKIIGIAMVGFIQFVLWIAITSTLASVGSAVLLKDKLDPKAIATWPTSSCRSASRAGSSGAMAMPTRTMCKLLAALIEDQHPAHPRHVPLLLHLWLSPLQLACWPPSVPRWTAKRTPNSSCSR
jgi:ABC-type Na+ efflux pump permease subunit